MAQWNCPATKDPETGDVYIRLGGSPDGIPGEAAVQRTLPGRMWCSPPPERPRALRADP